MSGSNLFLLLRAIFLDDANMQYLLVILTNSTGLIHKKLKKVLIQSTYERTYKQEKSSNRSRFFFC